MEVLTDDDVAIGQWLDSFIRQRDSNRCKLCGGEGTAQNPIIVEYKSQDTTLLPRHKNLWCVHWKCNEEYQARTREEDLRLRPAVQQPQRKRPKYWTVRRVLAAVVLLVDLALCYGCILFYKWGFRVFWP